MTATVHLAVVFVAPSGMKVTLQNGVLAVDVLTSASFCGSQVLRDVTACLWLGVWRRFEGIQCLRLQVMFLWTPKFLHKKALRSFETSGSTNPGTPCHIAEVQVLVTNVRN